MFLLHQSVYDAHFEKIFVVTTTKEVWDILQKCHAGNRKVKKVQLQSLRRQYKILKMKDLEKVADYFTRVITITIK